MIDDCNIKNLAENQVSAVFNLRAIRRSVSSKLIELCMEAPYLCPSEGHKHGGRNVTKTSIYGHITSSTPGLDMTPPTTRHKERGIFTTRLKHEAAHICDDHGFYSKSQNVMMISKYLFRYVL